MDDKLDIIYDKICHLKIDGLWKANYKEGYNDAIIDVCKIIKEVRDK